MDKLGIIFSLDEARCAGLTDAAVRHALACGRLVRVRRGLYCDAQRWGDAATQLVIRHALEARAAWLTIGRRGWACDYTATLLDGLPVPHGQPDRVTLSQATRAEGRRAYAPGFRLRTAMVDPVDIGFEWGMAVLRSARTALDVARNHGFAAGLALADAALARDPAIIDDLSRIAASMSAWRNGTAVDLVARHASGRRESPVESQSFATFVDFGLPLPECNDWIVGDRYSRGGIRADFVWKPYRMVGEADGRVKYTDPRGSADAVLVEEKARQVRIEEQGFVVVRWSGAEIQQRPDVVIDRIVRQSRIASTMYNVPLLVPRTALPYGR